ncbi:MAG: biotin transporter BioY [Planctomycetota bacterium]
MAETGTSGGRGARGRKGAVAVGVGAVLGAAAIWAGARIEVPMTPVPMTLQTLAVLLAGGLGGARVGLAAAALYLALALAGAPVLASGRTAGGMEFLDLKSGGYVVAFLAAGALAGRTPRGLVRSVGTMLLAHAVVLAAGWAWLARFLGPADALEFGVTPFLVGAAVKSLAAAVIVRVARGRARGDRP